VERGLNRRAKQGKPIADMTRLHDHDRPAGRLAAGHCSARHRCGGSWRAALGWDCPIKKAYELYRQKGFRTRLLAAAYRHHMHWSELIGGDLSMTISLRVAAPVQRVRRGGHRTNAEPGAQGVLRPPLHEVRGLPPCLRARRHDGGRVRQLRGDRAHASGIHLLVARSREPRPGLHAPQSGREVTGRLVRADP